MKRIHCCPSLARQQRGGGHKRDAHGHRTSDRNAGTETPITTRQRNVAGGTKGTHPAGPMTDGKRTTYTGIMGGPSGEGGPVALGPRLAELKRWAARDAGISVHSAVCVVNGKATDATRNAPCADMH